MTEIDLIERRIFLKRQLIELTHTEIMDLEEERRELLIKELHKKFKTKLEVA